jgi:1,2-diacylglycerol 3-alpha-glucosyltransferase
MKIAIFTDTFYPQTNGVSHFVINSAESLSEKGHDVRVFATMPSSHRKKFDSLGYKFKLETVPSVSVGFIYPGERFIFPLGWSFFRMRKFRPDVIHVHTPFSLGWEAVLASRVLKIPLIGEHHTFYDYYLKHIKMDFGWMKKVSWKITALYYNRCNTVISPTRSLAENLLDSGLKRPTKIIPNSIDIDFFHPVTQEDKNKIRKSYGINDFSLVYVGRISYEKNLYKLIKGFALLVKSNEAKDIKLMLVGDGPERKKLTDFADKLGLNTNVIWTGTLRGEKWRESFSCNDIFVTASKSENMPLTVLEAMACGLPMVVSSENGLKEIVRDGFNGYLFNADDEEEMAEKIKLIMNDKSKQETYSKNSRELALDYSCEKVASMLEECYQEVINNYKK